MKGYRFYKEYDSPQDKHKDKPNGNVFAVTTDTEVYSNRGNDYAIEGFGSIYLSPNSPCCFTGASLDWLHRYTKRISEAEARQIHPRLFERIEE